MNCVFFIFSQKQKRQIIFNQFSNTVDNSTSMVDPVKYDRQNTSLVECKACDTFVGNWYWENHLKSIIHENNVSKMHKYLDNVMILDFTVGNQIVSYKIKSKDRTALESPEIFLDSVKADILFLIGESLLHHSILKVIFLLHTHFTNKSSKGLQSFDFQAGNFIMNPSHDFNTFISVLTSTLVNVISDCERKHKDCSLKEIKSIIMTVNKFNSVS